MVAPLTHGCSLKDRERSSVTQKDLRIADLRITGALAVARALVSDVPWEVFQASPTGTFLSKVYVPFPDVD